jgi:hypothetical protein
VNRELLINGPGRVAMDDTFAKVNCDWPSEMIHESGERPGKAGMTPVHLPVDEARIITVSTCCDCRTRVRRISLPVSFRTLVEMLTQQPVSINVVARTGSKMHMIPRRLVAGMPIVREIKAQSAFAPKPWLDRTAAGSVEFSGDVIAELL